MSDSRDIEDIKRCTCRIMRRTSRVVTKYYDKALKTSGLHAPQLAMLADIAGHENITISDLASVTKMDQTTVTRNVEALRKKGYVNVRLDDEDSRRKCISISESGRNAVKKAFPLWREAQNVLEEKLGAEKYEEFLNTLKIIQKLTED